MCEVMPILTDVLVDCLSRAEQSINRMTHKYLRAFILNITYEHFAVCALQDRISQLYGWPLEQESEVLNELFSSTLRQNNIPKAIKHD